MKSNSRVTSVQELLDALEKLAKKEEDISLRNVLEGVGHRSFGPLLLLAGGIMAAPGIGDIPGVPTGVGIFTLLVAAQMLLRRNHVWLPRWLLERSITDERLARTIAWLRKPAGYLDLVVRKRLVAFTNKAGSLAISATCSVIALFTPLMEVVPFSANLAGAAVATFGLSLVAHDGLLAVIAFVLTAILIALTAYLLLS